MYNKIVVAGANGYLGQLLLRYFATRSKVVIGISRKPFKPIAANFECISWDGRNPGDWCSALEDADLLINLAGKNVNCRYTAQNKNEIISSRIGATTALGRAVAACKNPPKVWLNSSSATIYNASFDQFMTEESTDIGNDFSMTVCRKWEETFLSHQRKGVRQVILRTGIVLGRSGGALPTLLALTRAGLGGRQGDGKQYCSWIHESDFCHAIEFVVKNGASGIYNVTSPAPIPNYQFMKAVREAAANQIGLPSPRWVLEVGAFFIRTETELILKSRKVFPQRLLDEGFLFEFDEVNNALKDLCQS